MLGGKFAEKVLHGQFGAATNAINCAIECTGPYHSVAKNRYKIYKNILSAFKINKKPNKHGCYNYYYEIFLNIFVISLIFYFCSIYFN